MFVVETDGNDGLLRFPVLCVSVNQLHSWGRGLAAFNEVSSAVTATPALGSDLISFPIT